MRKIAITALALVFCGTAAWADEKPSEAEAKSTGAFIEEGYKIMGRLVGDF